MLRESTAPRTAWTAGYRSRSTLGWRARPTRPWPGQGTVEARGPAQPDDQDPGHRGGLPAITGALAEGISVNVTLIFSVERYRAVIDAFFAGLEQAKERTRTARRSSRSRRSSSPGWTPRWTSGWTRSAPTRPWRCVGRPPSPTPGWPTRIPAGIRQRRAGLALHAGRGQPQRPLWASTGVKNPAILRHPLRGPNWSPRHGQHDAGEDPGGRRRPRRDPRRHGVRHRRAGPAGVRPGRPRSASTSTTCSSCSRTRVWRSSRSRGRSCSTRSGANSSRRRCRADGGSHDSRDHRFRPRRIGPATAGRTRLRPCGFEAGRAGRRHCGGRGRGRGVDPAGVDRATQKLAAVDRRGRVVADRAACRGHSTAWCSPAWVVRHSLRRSSPPPRKWR